jgi:rod shape determining protein RodA
VERRRVNIFQNTDPVLIGMFLLLSIMGWLNIYAASYKVENPDLFDFSQEYGKQFVWIVTSSIIGASILLFDKEFFRRFAPHFYLLIMILLAGVLVFGVEINGNKAWYRFGSFAIQPSEFAKAATSLMLAAYLGDINTKMSDLKTKIRASIIVGIPVLLILLQPDVGTLLVYSGFVFVLYREGLSGNILIFGFFAALLSVITLLMQDSVMGVPFTNWELSGKYVLIGIVLLLTLLIYLVIKNFTLKRYRRNAYFSLVSISIASMFWVTAVEFMFEKGLGSHQKERINILLGLEDDPQGAGYNVKQSKTAIGSGGFSGKGFLQGTLTKYRYVPMQSTDFIFVPLVKNGAFWVLQRW